MVMKLVEVCTSNFHFIDWKIHQSLTTAERRDEEINHSDSCWYNLVAPCYDSWGQLSAVCHLFNLSRYIIQYTQNVVLHNKLWNVIRMITPLLSLFSGCDIRGTKRTDFGCSWKKENLGCACFLLWEYLFQIALVVSSSVIPGNT